jgi:hypothetical protein
MHYQRNGLQFLKTIFRTGLIAAFLVFFAAAFAQHPYHITNYKKSDYGAGNQNWDIDSDDQGNVFIANNQGLLELAGSSIILHELPAHDNNPLGGLH